ncbi:hypothetical protein D1872_332520 [compost metagenome]
MLSHLFAVYANFANIQRFPCTTALFFEIQASEIGLLRALGQGGAALFASSFQHLFCEVVAGVYRNVLQSFQLTIHFLHRSL